MLVNRATCPSTSGNVETGPAPMGRNWVYAAKPLWGRLTFRPRSSDLKYNMHRTCALVGNAPSLSRTPMGAAIDSHDAVWRFNFITGKDPTKLGGRVGGGVLKTRFLFPKPGFRRFFGRFR